jgi:hypothetical protein
MSDYNEDRAYEMGFVPEDEDILTEKEFADILRDRRPLLTEEDIVNRAPNIYQGPLKTQPVMVPWWAVGLFFVVFVTGVCVLLDMLS